MTLYSLRTALDDYRITKFDRDLNVESSYLIGPIIPNDHNDVFCECPAGTRSTCRHRQMLPHLLPLLDTKYFWDFERGVAVDANGNLRPPEPEIITPAKIHESLDELGENAKDITPPKPDAPWRRI